MSLTGPGDGEPYRLGVAIADIVAADVRGAGHHARAARPRAHRQGQFVDIGMLDSVASLLTYQAGIYFTTGATPTRVGNRHPSIAPYDTLPPRTARSCWPSATTGSGGRSASGRAWRRSADERFATNAARVRHDDAAAPVLARLIRTRATGVDRPARAGRRAVRRVRTLDEVLPIRSWPLVR